MPTVNKSILFIAVMAPILMASECGLPDYGTSHTANETTYLAKPPYLDTCASAIYASGRFSYAVAPNYENEPVYFGELTLHRSHTWKYVNLSYGIFGYYGSHKICQIEKYRGGKSFGGAGATGEFNFNIPFKKVDWRIIGARATWLYEDGKYASFREAAEMDSLIENINPEKMQFNFSATMEVLLKLDKVNCGFYLAIGKTIGNGEGLFTTSVATYLTHKRATYFAQWAVGDRQGMSLSGGITFRIHQKTAVRRGIRSTHKP